MGFLVEQLFGSRLMVQPTSPDLTGRIAIVTGANVGLGLATAVHLAHLNPARLILACRSLDKGNAALAMIKHKVPNFKGELEVWQLDLGSFKSVLAFGDRVNQLDRLDILCQNAGVATMKFSRTDDGFETTTQVNDLSTGLLALLALPLLNKTLKMTPIPTSADFKPHLTIVSSEVHMWATFTEKDVPGSTLDALSKEEHFVSADRYNVSKLLNQFITAELAALPLAQGLVVNSVNPGLCVSELRKEFSWFKAFILDSLARSADVGARNISYAATADTSSKPGAYISLCQIKPPGPYSVSPEGVAMQKKLWSEMSAVWKNVAPQVAEVIA